MSHYVIELYSLGHLDHGEPEKHDFDVQSFIADNSVARLEYNLTNLYAAVPPVNADGPAVSVKWAQNND